MLRIHTKDKEKFIAGEVFMKNLIALVAATLGLMLTFPLFISVILRFKQVVPFPSFSCWYSFRWCPSCLICCCSMAQSCPVLCDPVDYITPGFPDLPHLQNLLKLMSFESVMPSNHLILCHPLLLPSVFPNIRVFSDKSALHIRWPKYWNFSFSISPSNGYSGLISFKIDCFDLLAVRGTLKHHIQHRSSKASILQLLAFYIVQLLHPNMTTGKTITLTIQTFVSKVMSLLFNMLSRFVITFLPRSNYLPIFLAWESSAHSFKWQFRRHFSGESSLTTENWASCPSLHVYLKPARTYFTAFLVLRNAR